MHYLFIATSLVAKRLRTKQNKEVGSMSQTLDQSRDTYEVKY